MEKPVPASVLRQYPEVDESTVDILLAQEIAADSTKFIVLDDDPTGVQTVHGINVYTNWSKESIQTGLMEKNKLFYILTNSRGFTNEKTTAVHRTIAENSAEAAKASRVNYLFISRSDSTLRGHYPTETELLCQNMEAAGMTIDGEILCPYFKEGGRFTLNNTHYVQYGDQLIPAAQTEFARDPTFGYTKSNLPDYIEEKTKGIYKAKDVVCISLEEIRTLDYDGIATKLMKVSGFGKVVVNAIDDCDVKVVVIALYRAMRKGKRFLFRTAASFVKVIGGIPNIPLLQREDMLPECVSNGGVVVVGSHTNKTTAQLEELLTLPYVEPIALDSDLVLQGEEVFRKEVERCVALEEQAIRAGKVAVCFTRRTLLTLEDDTKESALLRSVEISKGVERLVSHLSICPAFIIAKGGITSSTIGTNALQVKCAYVLGQILPGIPVWKTDAESKFPGIPYVIFPGNVGTDTSLREAVEILAK